MGLASSQARLLCITMRINDDQYKLLKLGAEQISLSNKKADIADEYDYRKNAVNYSYNGNDQFTYSDLMGASGLTAGLDNPVFVTNSENKVVLDGAYGMAMQNAYMASNGKPKGSTTGFNAFVAQITGDSTTDWAKAATGKVSSSSNSTGSTGSTKGADVKDNTTTNGTTTKTQLTAEAQALRAKYDAAREYVAENFGTQPAKPGLNKNNNNLDYDLRQELDTGRTNRNNTYQKRLTIEDDIDVNDQNEKGYNYASWTTAVNKYCQQQGLTKSYVLNGGYPAEANKTETITVNNTNTNTNANATTSKNEVGNGSIVYNENFSDSNAKAKMNQFISQYGELPIVDQSNGKLLNNSKGYNRGTWMNQLNAFAKANGLTISNTSNNLTVNGQLFCCEGGTSTADTISTVSTGKSGSINEDGTVNDEKTIKAAKYYLQIYNQACNGYVVDEQITNRAYMNAQLENNNLKIDGQLASENENLKKGLAKDVDDENEKIERWYKKEMQSTESEEKRISIKQTSIQADLSALQTEQSSVQSLIDKNIERSFTYCQNG